jgi:hypothetical protein
VIRVVTSTCRRDVDYLRRLNGQLAWHRIEHRCFVEAGELPFFRSLDLDAMLHIKPDGGDNGLGRGGSVNRWAIHRHILPLVADVDTVVHLDSDVYFPSERLLSALERKSGEVAGFTNSAPPLTCKNGASFFHMSGMLMTVSGDVYRRAWDMSREAVWNICQHLLDSGHECSEDVSASYLYQCVGNGQIVKLEDQFVRAFAKRIEDAPTADVIC